MSDEQAARYEQAEREWNWASGRLSEDLQFNVVPGGPVDYASRTDKAVEYVAVAAGSTVLGYLWACDADDAAGWQVRPAGGDGAYNAGVAWTRRLRGAKDRGISPSQALAELAQDPGGPYIGQVVPGSRARAESLADLRRLAGDDGASPASPPAARRRGA
ncbi:hypothetical protein AB0D08_27970 [Kitasatospora sp. NPDC048540]|uniref:hypothetical protein n=1 Tax=Kitasatospora sp. NPDC048540 TaxID=3155634 RepID=UPI0033FB279C